MEIRRVSRTTLQQDIYQRSSALGIPRSISTPFKKLIWLWISNSGVEWTVDRLKAIKLDLIHKKAGLPPVSVWIGKSRRTGKFSGMIGSLETFMLTSDKCFSKGLQLLQCYTLFFAPVITDKQKDKALTAIQSTQLTFEQTELANQLVHKGWLLNGQPHIGKLAHPSPLECMIPSTSKTARAPLPGKTVPEIQGIIDSVSYLYDTFEGNTHLNRYYNSHYKYVLKNIESRIGNDYGHFIYDSGFPTESKFNGSLLAGKISLLQEGGYKLRYVSNPGRIFQCVLKPLQTALDSFNKTSAWDCTHDQSKAFPIIRECLAQNKMVHCIDLTGATDYFPLSTQEHLLRLMCDSEDINLFSDLSKASWEFPGVGQVHWTRGQPLGLNPSFAAFALTHGHLLLGLLNRPFNDEFFVLGDDVVILDDKLASSYYSFMEFIGSPISYHKCLSSTKLAEFGGKLLTDKTVIPQFKWKEVSDDSFIDLARNLGHQSICMFRPRQISVLKELAIVPEFFGGLGWNPNGLPLEDRLKSDWIYDPKHPVDRLMDYSPIVISNLLNSELYRQVTFSQYGSNIIEFDGKTLDQRVSSLINKYLGNSFKNFPRQIIGKNLSVCSSLQNEDLLLPPKSKPVGRIGLLSSLLISWEAKLFRLR